MSFQFQLRIQLRLKFLLEHALSKILKQIQNEITFQLLKTVERYSLIKAKQTYLKCVCLQGMCDIVAPLLVVIDDEVNWERKHNPIIKHNFR